MKNIRQYTSGFDVPLFIYNRKLGELSELQLMEYNMKYYMFEQNLYNYKKVLYPITSLLFLVFGYLNNNMLLYILSGVFLMFFMRLITTYRKYLIADNSMLNFSYYNTLYKYYGGEAVKMFFNDRNNYYKIRSEFELLVSDIRICYMKNSKYYYYCSYYKNHKLRYFLDYIVLYWFRVVVKIFLPFNII